MEDKMSLLTEVAQYYSSKLAQHGDTPQGVDWKNGESQTLRFEQLTRIIRDTESFSVNDLGSGYGALFDFLAKKYNAFSYSGFDVSQAMVGAANRRHSGEKRARFIVASQPDQISDYGIASGILNVRMGRSNQEWANYIETVLEILNKTSRLGFAFNCLTIYSDQDKMREDLYYADPSKLFDFCKRRYARDVALLHDYGLYEFTILVRKQS